MSTEEYYESLPKPRWSPPADFFGPVWLFLYILIGLIFGYIFYLTWTDKIPWFICIPFIVNLVVNFLYFPMQFTLKKTTAATILCALCLSSLVVGMAFIFTYAPEYSYLAYCLIPYLVWMCVANGIQLTVFYNMIVKKQPAGPHCESCFK